MSTDHEVAMKNFVIEEKVVLGIQLWSSQSFIYRLVAVSPPGVGMASKNGLISGSAHLPASWHEVQSQNVQMFDDANHLIVDSFLQLLKP